MDGLAVTASLSPGEDTAKKHQTSYGLSFTGVEGLTLNYGTGDSGVKGSEVDKYYYACFLRNGCFLSRLLKLKMITNNSPEITGLQLGYTVSDDLSVTYGQETFDQTGTARSRS